jgi:hypothetical protein
MARFIPNAEIDEPYEELAIWALKRFGSHEGVPDIFDERAPRAAFKALRGLTRAVTKNPEPVTKNVTVNYPCDDKSNPISVTRKRGRGDATPRPPAPLAAGCRGMHRTRFQKRKKEKKKRLVGASIRRGEATSKKAAA